MPVQGFAQSKPREIPPVALPRPRQVSISKVSASKSLAEMAGKSLAAKARKAKAQAASAASHAARVEKAALTKGTQTEGTFHSGPPPASMEPGVQVKLEAGEFRDAYAALRAAPFAAAELRAAVARWCAPRVKEHEHQGRHGPRFSTSLGTLRLDDLAARGRLSAEAAAGLEELCAQAGEKFDAETPAAAELLFRLRVLDRWQAFDPGGAEPAALGGRPAAAAADVLEMADGVDLSAEQEEELVGEGGLESVQVRSVGEPLAKRIKAEPDAAGPELPTALATARAEQAVRETAAEALDAAAKVAEAAAEAARAAADAAKAKLNAARDIANRLDEMAARWDKVMEATKSTAPPACNAT